MPGGERDFPMNRRFYRLLAVAVMAVTLQSQAARAEDHNLFTFLFGHQDPRLTGTGIALGLGSDAASYALVHKHGFPPHRIASPGFAFGLTSFGCAVVFPIIATLVVNRPLTPREADSGIADCVIPFIGGWLVEAAWGGDPWFEGKPAPRHHWRRYRHYHHHG
jgi:hypothetical protein